MNEQSPQKKKNNNNQCQRVDIVESKISAIKSELNSSRVVASLVVDSKAVNLIATSAALLCVIDQLSVNFHSSIYFLIYFFIVYNVRQLYNKLIEVQLKQSVTTTTTIIIIRPAKIEKSFGSVANYIGIITIEKRVIEEEKTVFKTN